MYQSAITLWILFTNLIVILFLGSTIYYIGVERNKIKGNKMLIDFFQFSLVILLLVNSVIVFITSNNYENSHLHFLYFILIILIIKLLFFKFYREGCPVMFNCVLFLLATCLIFLYKLNPMLALGQSRYILLGFSSFLFLPLFFKIAPNLDKLAILYYLTGVFLLLTPNIFNSESFLGAKNWVEILGVRFQPSELVKFIFIFYLASTFRRKLNFFRLFLVSIFSGIYIIILATQNDFGAALIFFMAFLTLLYIRTGSISLFLLGFIGASSFAFLAYLVASHIQVRVAIWLNPWETPYTSGYQILQSLFALGSYVPFGTGLTNGYSEFIPIIESDLIFSGITEEFGTIFGLSLIIIYLIIFYRGVNIALRSKSFFHSFLVIGFTSILTFQSFLILAGTSKLLPLTGVTLPFVSHGGTSMVSSLYMMGILQLIFIYNKRVVPVKIKENICKEKQETNYEQRQTK